MVRTQIQLTEEQMALLKKVAAEQTLSVAELIRRAVDALLRSSNRINDETQQRRALSIIGQFPDPAADLSINHDQYLVQAFTGETP
ncbi:MAG: ribbon-helix-helix protein, CopG family [Chloroflexi bacterium]|nr:ribbon-helix-helix protein, CopG family [Chloroflexota bacterium]